MSSQIAPGVRNSLLLLSCLGLVACGDSTVVGVSPPASDASVAEVAVDGAVLPDVTIRDTGAADVGTTDADATDANVADGVVADAADVTSTDSSAMDAIAVDAATMDAIATEVGMTDAGGEAGASDGASAVDGRADATTDAGTDAATVMDVVTPIDVPACVGTHPLLDAGARFCASGQCYCPTSGTNGDSCLPAATAAACCPGRTVSCAGGGDAGSTCPAGTHPLVDGGARYCDPGLCYCPSPGIAGDSCLPAAVAAACCPGRSVTCSGAADAGTTCPTGTHPLLDAGLRYCASGSCYCPSTDACRPVAVARMCCPTAVICY